MGSAESAATRPETEYTFSLCLELIRFPNNFLLRKIKKI